MAISATSVAADLILPASVCSPPSRSTITTGVAVSPEPGVLAAMARGEGPKRTIFAVGYAGWAAGQLEHEMDRKDWYTAPVDLEIVFDKDMATKWKRAVEIRYRTL